MKYIIVSDIFGKTAHLSNFAKQFTAKSIIVDPYDGQLQSVSDEQSQYDFFITACGHDNYFNKLNIILSRVAEPTTLIGFSAGGTAAWRSQAIVKNSQIKKLVAFYPNQVRHYLDLPANVACEFIFAKQEAHFDIHPVIACLEQQIKVQCQQVDYGHGFMNPLSKCFDSFGYQQYSQYLSTENN
ncbi:dienelactone hydrolase family protein [Pseudoalteromonas ostreae]|uniref:dienelactone hydrolase family protein n=1 Tax=Pseudoalteromonas ostreae TaxID=2774154 RepID=UPI001B36E2E6|nr:dienelactone hydrolase family protein [Pseudoalteromonas ostreae]